MIESLIKLLNSLKFLNWQKLAELTVLIIILVCGLALYENRTKVYDAIGASAWAVAVTADTTNGRPKISVTGEASKTIRWVANIRMTKVSG